MTGDAAPTAVVTGATSGVGRAVVEALLGRGWTVVAHARNEEKAATLRTDLGASAGPGELRTVTADLARLDEVGAMAERIVAAHPRLDALVNNAGLAKSSRTITEDGFELTMQVNHLAHFLLTARLVGPLREGSARVVHVSSKGHRGADLGRAPLESILRGEGGYKGLRAYADSKLANILFSRELARRKADAGITSNALHPGVLSTDIWNRNRNPLWAVARLFKPFMDAADDGGEAVTRLITDPELEGVTGRYWDETERAEPRLPPDPAAMAAQLWDVSARAVGAEP